MGSLNNPVVSTFFTTWTNLTGTRVINTVYQNTGAKPMFVNVAGVAGTLECATGAANPPTVTADSTAGGETGVSFMVPSGYYYKVTGSGISSWIEVT